MFIEFRNINNKRGNLTVEIMTQVGLAIFIGARGLIFTDWLVYYPMFDKMPTIWDGFSVFGTDFADLYGTDESIERTGTELGFVYYTLIFKSILPNFHAWVFFSSVIDFVLLHIFIKRYSPYYVLGFICFYVFEGLGIEVNLMRNVKAIVFFLVSIKYLEERKPIPYFLLNTLGFFFHSSAILYFPLYFVLHKKWSKKFLWSIFGLGILILLFQIHYLSPILMFIGEKVGGRIGLMIQFYLASDLYSSSFGLLHFGYLERVATFSIMIGLYDRLSEAKKSNVIFLNTLVIYYFAYSFLSEIKVIIERVPLLFVFSYWILYPNLFALVKKRINKALIMCALLLFTTAKFLKSNNNIFVKYDNVLFGIDSYELRNERFINHSSEIVDNE
jgi:hypothetical protein